MIWLLEAALVGVVVLCRWQRSGQKVLDFLGLGLVYLYARLWHRWSSTGPILVPPQGAGILVANHTCSADPAFLTAGCWRAISFIIADEHYNIPVLQRLLKYMGCVPAKRNGQDVAAARAALRRLHQGGLVCIFPEGGLSYAGRRRLGRGKAGAALLALRSRMPVYPVLIRGGPQTSDLLRSWLRPSRVHVTFGPAVDLSAYYGRPINRKLMEEVSRQLMSRIAALEKPHNEEFPGLSMEKIHGHCN